jgi:hypothetical protein
MILLLFLERVTLTHSQDRVRRRTSRRYSCGAPCGRLRFTADSLASQLAANNPSAPPALELHNRRRRANVTPARGRPLARQVLGRTHAHLSAIRLPAGRPATSATSGGARRKSDGRYCSSLLAAPVCGPLDSGVRTPLGQRLGQIWRSRRFRALHWADIAPERRRRRRSANVATCAGTINGRRRAAAAKVFAGGSGQTAPGWACKYGAGRSPRRPAGA